MKNRRGTWSIDPTYNRAAEATTPAEAVAPKPGASPAQPAAGQGARGEQEGELERMELFVAEVPLRRLSGLIVADATMQQIKSMLAKVEHHVFLYEQWNLKQIDPHGGRTAINLYGPPGTGKSLCAEAIAAELNKRMIRVNYAEIESKYVGDTPKNIKAAFAKARAEDALLFFDEADSILGRRLTNVTQSADHGVNVSRSVMLMELDRFTGVTIFATNLASNYDGAFVRRILGHIEMPLPDRDCRFRLWQLHIPSQMEHSLRAPQDYHTLAELTEGLSGGDILTVVVSAATVAVQRTGSERRVKLEDLAAAVGRVRKAKDEIGQPRQRAAWSSTSMPLDLAPEDVRQAYRAPEDDAVS